MADAITLFYNVLQIIVSWIFNAEIVSGVSIGWIFVSIAIFCILIRSVLNIPKSSNSFNVSNNDHQNYYYKKH